MKKQLPLLTLISILLVACSPQVTVTSEVIATAQTEIVIPTLIATPTQTPVNQESDPNEYISPAQEQARQALVADALSGKLNLGEMTLEQANEVRSEIAEYMKTQGLVHVTFDAGGSNPAYLSPEDFTLHQLGDGKSEAKQSIQMYHEVRVDAEGYLWVTNLQGERVKIDGSVGMNLSAIVDNPQSTEIEWPTTPVGNSGLPDAQWFLTLDKNPAYRPVVLLDKTVGNFFFKDFNNGRGSLTETLRFYMIVTDKQGNPLYARMFIAAPAGQIVAMEEGSDVQKVSRIVSIENTGMHKLLAENSIYWAGVQTNQAAITDHPNSSAGYAGIVSETQSGDVFTGETSNQQDLLVLLMRMLIKTNP